MTPLPLPSDDDVRVRIDEAGHDDFAGGVDNLFGFEPRGQIACRPDGDDLLTSNGDCASLPRNTVGETCQPHTHLNWRPARRSAACAGWAALECIEWTAIVATSC